jgi:hypothetical protein
VSRRFGRCQSATCRYAPGFLSSAICVGLDHAGAAPPSNGGDFGVREALLDETGRSAAAEALAGEMHISVAQLCEPVPEGCVIRVAPARGAVPSHVKSSGDSLPIAWRHLECLDRGLAGDDIDLAALLRALIGLMSW